MKKYSKGISLIVLVITILVILVLVGAVVLVLQKNNTLNQANEALFKNDVKTFMEELNVNLLNKLTENPEVNISQINANKYSMPSIMDYIDSMNSSTKYQEILAIENGKLVYIGKYENERKWAREVNVESGKQFIEDMTFDISIAAKIDAWEIKIENIKEPENKSIKYKLTNTNEWLETKENTFLITSGGNYDIQLISSYGNTLTKTISLYEPKGLQLYLDGENNTGTGYDNTATTWKDLSNNLNDVLLSNFDNNINSGWNNKYLSFDGVNDIGKTSKIIDYKQSKEITIQFTDVDKKIFENNGYGILFESSVDTNVNIGGYYIDYNQFGRDTMSYCICKNPSGLSHNIKTASNITKEKKCNVYTIILNTTNPYNTFISFYINGEKQILTSPSRYVADISNQSISNYVLYIGR